MDFLNQLTSQTGAAESVTYHIHPLGSYNGVVTGTEKKVINDRPVWELTIKTAVGLATHNIWGFSPQDVSMGQHDAHSRERMVKNIARIKRMIRELGGIVPDSEIDGMGWNQGELSVVGVLDRGMVHGKKCRIVVKVDDKKPDRRTVFVNPFEDIPDAPEAEQASMTAPGTQNGYNAGMQTPQSQQSQPITPPGLSQSMGDIPF